MKTTGEQIAEISAEMDALGRPDALKSVLARKPLAPKIWDINNPEKAAKYWDLFAKREELYVLADAEFSGESKMTPKQAGIPEFASKAPEKPIETLSLVSARGLLGDASKPFLALSGAPGCGKTMAASLVSEAAVKMGWFVQFVVAGELARLGIWGEEGARIDILKDCKLLVLDDLGTEMMSQTWSHNFHDLIDSRYQNQRKTIITTNLNFEDFSKRYGARTTDRIVQCGRFLWAGNKSLRRQQTRQP